MDPSPKTKTDLGPADEDTSACHLPSNIREALIAAAPDLLDLTVRAEMELACRTACPKCGGGVLPHPQIVGERLAILGCCNTCGTVFSPSTGLISKLGYA